MMPWEEAAQAQQGSSLMPWDEAAQNLNSNQPTSQNITQNINASPANSNQMPTNQGDILHSAYNWANSPTNLNLPTPNPSLPFSQKILPIAETLGKGLMGAGEDIVAKPFVGGLSELMLRAGGEKPMETDQPFSQNSMNISPNALMTLGMLSPASPASNLSNIVPQQPKEPPIGNQLVSSLSPQNLIEKLQNVASEPDVKIPNQGNPLVKGFGATSAEELPGIADSMKANAGKIYDQMRQAGAIFSDDKTDDIVDDIDNALQSKQFIPQLNPKTVAIVDHIKNAAENDNLGLDQLDQYRRLLTRVGNTEDGVSAGLVKKAIDNAVNTATPEDLEEGNIGAVSLLNQGRQAYQQASKYEDVADVIAKANGDPNRIKQLLTNFSKNEDNTRGWTTAEKSALNQAKDTGIGENLLKAFGKFGFDFSKSGTGNTALPALSMMSSAFGNPIGIPLAVGGTIARQGQKYLARGYAQNLLDALKGSQ